MRVQAREYVMRSLPETAAAVKAEMAEAYGDTAVDSAFANGLLHRVSVPRRAQQQLNPDGLVFAHAETINAAQKKGGARRLAVVSAFEAKCYQSYRRLKRYYDALVKEHHKSGPGGATADFMKRLAPQLIRAEGYDADLTTPANVEDRIQYLVVDAATDLTAVVHLHVYFAILEAKSAVEILDALSSGATPCSCRHFEAQGTWCGHILAAIAKHQGEP